MPERRSSFDQNAPQIRRNRAQNNTWYAGREYAKICKFLHVSVPQYRLPP